MGIKDELLKRSGSKCELCSSTDNLTIYEVTKDSNDSDKALLVCEACSNQLNNFDAMDTNHWHCLNESMWSEVPAVKVMAYRVLTKISNQDMLDMLYLEPELEKWAKEGLVESTISSEKDSNGQTLNEGDSVTIIKDLDVKGARFTAKRGTIVKNIHLCDVEGHIEGRVNGVKIYLKSEFLKKV